VANPIKSDPILTPELVKILKVFGLISVSLVVILSFFNDRRANNTGEDPTFRMSNSARLYFLNVRGMYYEREIRRDAGMVIYKNNALQITAENPSLNMILILNPVKDEAYIYFEPQNSDWPIKIRLNSNDSITYSFENGNKSAHLQIFEILKPSIFNSDLIEMQTDKGWIAIWSLPKEKEAVKAIIEDYQKLTQ
jgi:hypothetical protein